MKFRALILATFLAATACVSCSNGRQVYQVQGTVREVKADDKTVTIAHEEIPGYMVAMTMDFAVTNAAELNGLRPGDVVTFRMTVTKDDGWIDQITRTGSNAPLPAPENMRRVRYVEPLAIGDALPEYTFTNELGRVIKSSDFKGKAAVLNFIFTRCPFPTYCPRTSKGLQEAQAMLKSRKDAPANWHFLSITIDPAYDTPPRLKGYGKSYDADPKHWSFLTGSLEDITAIAEQFGLQFWRDTPESLPNHNMRTVVIDAAGRVQWVTVQNEWKPEELVEHVIKAAQVK